MKKTIQLLIFICFSYFFNAQSQNFVTVWSLPNTGSGSTQIQFNATIAAGGGSYTWKELSPGNTTGSGTLAAGTALRTITGLPFNSVIEFSISPTNLQRFYIDKGADRLRLGNIKSWGTANWTSMAKSFYGCENMFCTATDAPNLSSVTDMTYMFRECYGFNANINSWNVSNVTNMNSMFYQASYFNEPLNSWDVSKVTNMASMFYQANYFNQPLNNWNTSSAINMSSMFYQAISFNQPLNNWNVANATTMTSMFSGASLFNQTLGSWTLNANASMSNMLNNTALDCANYSNTLINWSTNPSTPNGRVLGATNLEYGYNANSARNTLINTKGWTINGDAYTGIFCSNDFVTTWDLSESGSGANQIQFNATIATGDATYTWKEISPGSATGSGVLTTGTSLRTISGLPASSIIELSISSSNLQRFFINNISDRFRLKSVNSWGTTNWTSMAGMFYGCTKLDYIPSLLPNITAVTDMSYMFAWCANYYISNFDKLNLWNVSNVTNMSFMFSSAQNFNGDLSNWNTSNVTNMSNMFANCWYYNQPLNNWNTANVTNMSKMFHQAFRFNQPLNSWRLNANVDMTNMLESTSLDCYNYSKTLNGWNSNPLTPNNRILGSCWNKEYGTSAAASRANLTTTKGWTITGDIASTSNCGDDFITRWDLSQTGSGTSQIQFNAAIATGGGSYTWKEISPGSNYGSGLLAAGTSLRTISGLPANGLIELKISNTNLQTIYISDGADKKRLISVEQWGTANWTSMASSFYGCENMVCNATDMPNLTAVSDLGGMFGNCKKFNSNINNWNISNVTNTTSMFYNAGLFNQPLNNWDVSNVDYMSWMFAGARAFNQPLYSWNVSKATNMSYMFTNATAFDQPLNNWNTEKVVDISNMFQYATTFNQNLGNWNLKSTNSLSLMFTNSGLDCSNYSKTLIGWAANPNTHIGLSFGANGMQYGTNALSARNTLITTKGWNITGDATSGGYCSENFITEWDLTRPMGGSTDIKFHTEIATGGCTYTWKEISPGNATGSGTLAAGTSLITISGLPINSHVELSISPTNLKRFYIYEYAFDLYKLDKIVNWGTANWTNMANAFKGCSNLTCTAQDAPNLSGVTSMYQMFKDCGNFNSNINSWNVSNITNMESLFENASNFNQPLNNWNTASVTTMKSMFRGTSKFNQNINSWNTSNVYSMQYMFSFAFNYNQPLNNWNVSNVSSMSYMFTNARNFNQPLDNWILNAYSFSTSNIFDNSGLDCKNYSKTLNGWSNNPLTPNNKILGSLGLHYGTNALAARTNLTTTKGWTITGDTASASYCSNDFITRWDMSKVGSGASQIQFNTYIASGGGTYTWKEISPGNATGSGTLTAGNFIINTISGLPSGNAIIELTIDTTNLQRFFIQNGLDRQRLTDISNWGTSNWTSMNAAFSGCINMQMSATDIPNLTGVTDMEGMFSNCIRFNGDINNWNVGNVTNMNGLFYSAFNFNKSINSWNTGNVTTMFEMFSNATKFNQSLNNWNTSKVTNMASMFYNAKKFNSIIYDWNTSNVIYMDGMFREANDFNMHLNTWNVSNVKRMAFMFDNATSFNQPLDQWNTINLRDARYMFNNATSFNKYIGNWTLNSIIDLSGMLDNSGMDCENYSKTLIGWSSNSLTSSNKTLGATGMQYGTSALAARNKLTTTKGWTISGDTSISSTCNNDFVTIWDLSKTGSGATQIQFKASVDVGGTTYTWQEISPGNASGIGTLAEGVLSLRTISGLPANAIIKLSIAPDNFPSFKIDLGLDRSRLIDISNWGTTPWANLYKSFYGCNNLGISATDIPDLSNVYNMSYMFAGCFNLNANINTWNVSNVGEMSNLFMRCEKFNQPLNNWNVSSVTDMSFMFLQARAFNQPLNNWNTRSVQSMSSMFQEANAFNQALNGWNVSNVTSIFAMFFNTSAFNQPLDNWNTARITDMSFAFGWAAAFNQNLANWTLNSNADLNNMLERSGINCKNYANTLIGWAANPLTPNGRSLGALNLEYGTSATAARANLTTTKGWTITGDIASTAFCGNDEFITRWNLSNTGSGATQIQFNATIATGGGTYTWKEISPGTATGNGTLNAGTSLRTITGLPTGSIIQLSIAPTNLQRFYINKGADKQRIIDVENWGLANWTSMGSTFSGCNNLIYSTQDAPNLSGVTNMSSMFDSCVLFNGNINSWNVSNIIDMGYAFKNASTFNQPLDNWNTANVVSMFAMFLNASSFNKDISSWNTAKVINMNSMFMKANSFNQPLNTWNTANVTNMGNMFANASVFNQPLNNWNTEKVNNMGFMFATALAFNKDISVWNTTAATNMSYMFANATSFNQPLNNWNTNNVTSMRAMLSSTPVFNQPLDNWNTENVTDMSYMFYDALALNQNLGNWKLNANVNLTYMLNNSGLDCDKYSKTLIGWNNNPSTPNNRILGATGLLYNNLGKIARTNLITNKGWTVTGDTFTINSCSNEFITTWDLSKPGSGTTQIQFFTTIATGGANYTWQEISPGNASGSGTIAAINASEIAISGLPSNAIIQLSIAPINLKRFYIKNGSDKLKLIDVNNWSTAKWTGMSEAFIGCSNLNCTATDIPDLSFVTSLRNMFSRCSTLSGPSNINDWNTSTIIGMNNLFDGATNFNQNISNWNTSSLISMSNMFNDAVSFNQPLTNWNVSNVKNMSNLFSGAITFNQPLNNWNLSNVIDMSNMFNNTKAFNQDLSNWDVSNVTNMSGMFEGASQQRSRLSPNSSILNNTLASSLGNWDVSKVTNMSSMFKNATLFNGEIKDWNVSAVTNMESMFENATAFNQSLVNWNIGNVTNMKDFLSNSGVDISNYDNTLIAWEAQTVKPNVILGSSGLRYCTGATARGNLINNSNWNISGDNLDCVLPVELVSFNVSKQNEDALLTWKTASEFNNKGFEIEYSTDATNWTKIAFVDGHGNSNTVNNYSYLHEETANGINYYRLKQIDFDGKYSYSNINAITFDIIANSSVKIYPNPVVNILNIESNDIKNIRLISANGVLVLQEQITSPKTTFDMSNYPNGIYFIYLNNNDAIKIIKQ